jgi:single-strand DNA-binding protein
MATGMNKVMLIGNLGKDPEIKFTASGTGVCNLRIACTERAKQKDGSWADKTEWVTVVCFGKTAENVSQFLTKGRQVFVEGRLQTRDWTDKEGHKRTSTEVVAYQLLFLGGKEGGGSGGGGSGGGGGGSSRPAAGPPRTGGTDEPGDEPPPLGDEDIPF